MKKELFFILVFFLLISLIQCSHNKNPLGNPKEFEERVAISQGDYFLGGEIKVISDFETFNGYTNWKPSDDTGNRDCDTCPWGNSTASNFRITTNVSDGYFLKFKYFLGPDYQYRFANTGVGDFNIENPADLKLNAIKFDGFTLRLRGSGHKLRIKVFTSGSVQDSATDWDPFGYTIEETPKAWTDFVIRFFELEREGWGESWVTFNQSHITKFEFQASSQITNEQGWYDIDNLQLVENIYER